MYMLHFGPCFPLSTRASALRGETKTRFVECEWRPNYVKETNTTWHSCRRSAKQLINALRCHQRVWQSEGDWRSLIQLPNPRPDQDGAPKSAQICPQSMSAEALDGWATGALHVYAKVNKHCKCGLSRISGILSYKCVEFGSTLARLANINRVEQYSHAAYINSCHLNCNLNIQYIRCPIIPS